jgi:hypothetical protein
MDGWMDGLIDDGDFSMVQVIIHKTNPTGWWLGEINGTKGLFPYNYVALEESVR